MCIQHLKGIEHMEGNLDQRLSEATGCSNHGCVIYKPKGMGTNGGCNCSASKLRAYVRDLKAKVVEQGMTISRLTFENTQLVSHTEEQGRLHRIITALEKDNARLDEEMDKMHDRAFEAEALVRSLKGLP